MRLEQGLTEEADTFVPLHVANVTALDRAAHCYVNNGRTAFSLDAPPFYDLFDYWFWETMYGQASDDPADVGLIYLDPYWDC
jgi:hypothetical protein